VTKAPANAVDGKDIAINKSISMNDWQMNLTKSLQKANPNGKITATTSTTSNNIESTNNHGGMSENEQHTSSSVSTNSTEVSIVKGATTLGNKAFSPNLLKIKAGSTVTWINNDNTIHTITSGKPNTPNAGEAFDSGLTALIMPAKTFSHTFTNIGEFSYFCRLHPNMMATITVVQ
jgi:nitrite reductase (NO-forming)